MAPIETTQLAVPSGARRGKSFEAGGFGVIFKICGEETNGLLSVVEHPIEPGILIPPHIHEVEDEYSYVLEGEIGARIGDQVLRAPVGGLFRHVVDLARALGLLGGQGLTRLLVEGGGRRGIAQRALCCKRRAECI